MVLTNSLTNWCPSQRRQGTCRCQAVCLSRQIHMSSPLPPLAEKASIHAGIPLFIYFLFLRAYILLVLYRYRDSVIQLHFSVDRTPKCIRIQNTGGGGIQEKNLLSTIFSGVPGRTDKKRFAPAENMWQKNADPNEKTIPVRSKLPGNTGTCEKSRKNYEKRHN